ncbi:MAG: hypothetical protein HGA72_09720, partial [Chlorobiaceae bacterium]|nr:hypothetical protein [Chlorobiaceae bacterium]
MHARWITKHFHCSRQLFFQWMNHGQDHLMLCSANPRTGAKRIVYEERQPTWVEFFEEIYFFKDNSGFLFQTSDQNWDEIYHYSLDGRLIKQITREPMNVKDVVLVEAEGEGVTKEEALRVALRAALEKGGKQEIFSDTKVENYQLIH